MEIPDGTWQQLPQERGLSLASLQLLAFGQLQIKRKRPIEALDLSGLGNLKKLRFFVMQNNI